MAGEECSVSAFDSVGKKPAFDTNTSDLCTIVIPRQNGYAGKSFQGQASSILRIPFRTMNKMILPCLTSLIPVLMVVVMYTLGKSYVKHCVVWLNDQDGWLVCVMFSVLYTAVSFPVVWGYVVLNLACGYHFGLVSGFIVTAFGACVGLSLAHVTMGLCSECLRKHLVKHKGVNSVVQFMKGHNAFKVVVASRLSPVPFGIQNAIFAISGVRLAVYVLGSVVGLLPTQVINAYLGTTLRSLEEVLSNDQSAATAYVLLLVQVMFSFLLMAFIVRSAKFDHEESTVAPT